MGEPAKRRATYEELLAVPEPLVAEIIHGVLITHPRPGAPHARAASRLGIDVGGPFDRGKGGPGGWVILDEPELHRHGDVLVPDLAGWRRERMPEIPSAAAFELPPDWACEVLSPSTAAVDRADKPPSSRASGSPTSGSSILCFSRSRFAGSTGRPTAPSRRGEGTPSCARSRSMPRSSSSRPFGPDSKPTVCRLRAVHARDRWRARERAHAFPSLRHRGRVGALRLTRRGRSRIRRRMTRRRHRRFCCR